MQITKLKIRNFRSFGDVETTIPLKDLSALIGSNSSGKTAALQALLKLFGTTSKERTIQRSDFHVPDGVDPITIASASLYIEAVIEFPELAEGTTVENSTVPPHFMQMVVDNEGEPPYVRMRLTSTWQRTNTPEGETEQQLHYILASESEDISDTDLIPVSSTERSRIQMLYVPASRDPSVQLKNASGTILWRLLNGINWPGDMEAKLSDQMKVVNDLFDTVEGVNVTQSVLQSEWGSMHKDARYSRTGISFHTNNVESILKKVEVNFEPTELPTKYTVDELGDGLRSIFYLSLVSTLLKIENDILERSSDSETDQPFNIIPPALTILGVEEPENHVAPHLLGRIVKNLTAIAQRANSQVLISTHTPAMVKRVDPEHILHLRIDSGTDSTVVKTIQLPPNRGEAFKYVKNAVQAFPELYFARLVILGEGDSEEIVISRLLEAFDSEVDLSALSVVPLGGRHVNHFWRLLNQLEIPYITLLDLDRERDGGGWGRIKYVIQQLLANQVDHNSLLTVSTEDGGTSVLSAEDLDEMHEWDVTNTESMEEWITSLEEYGVFFSKPLDLDFMMLKAFEQAYRSTVPSGGGPRIPDIKKEPKEYSSKRQASVRATLKDQGGDGTTYEDSELDLMIWYNYLFLTRGKPATHILALTNITDEALKKNVPESLRKLMTAIRERL
ncbi:ATP-dependent nuclease [Alicyclobacillus ferrooxydans]|uniref:ATP-dependent endonuclease n=1 Tax=Alicyclobacillus ferrooxydans TaxID=471514 RepID=A0A0P9CQL7_9BACL|nr:AAA family ATPase [Alicyclobacillus ferrooxydans]KPV45184.1 hypothetical protein AN477_03300 [Alicyclobacillus ferrooxydans]